MSFSSDEINYLILRYLNEAGLHHTAYLFQNETKVNHVDFDPNDVPTGALIKILQKGMYYAEAELLSLQDPNGPQQTLLKERIALVESATDPEHLRYKLRLNAAEADQRERDRLAREKHTSERLNGLPPQRRERGIVVKTEVKQEIMEPLPYLPISVPLHELFSNKAPIKEEQMPVEELNDPVPNGTSFSIVGKKQAAAALGSINGQNGMNNGDSCELDRSAVRILKKHHHEVFICSWSPKDDLLASGSGDSTARIWQLRGTENPSTSSHVFEENGYVLKHNVNASGGDGQKPTNKDVTSLDWNNTGDLLATGCYDGYARVWDTSGNLLATLGAHKGPIFALKWNQLGDRVLSAGVDKSTIVWEPIKNQQIQQFTFHTSSALDVDWISEDTFASCSTDQTIHVCRIGQATPVRTYVGHKHEVNAIKYDPHSQRLASCSDDMTIKIWSLQDEQPLHNLAAHDREIYTIRWSPIGYQLASASFDHTVRVWDVVHGTCLKTFSKHSEPVYSVGFSPDGRLLASGSFDKCVYIWDTQSGQLINSYTGGMNDGGIFEVAWNKTGEKLAACGSDGSVVILDTRHLKSQLPSDMGNMNLGMPKIFMR